MSHAIPVAEALKQELVVCNHGVTMYGVISKKKMKNAKKDLESCRRGVVDADSVRKDEVLRMKRERLEEQINTFWKQRSHV